ncbi:alpha/beta fold hydrolase [Phytohabitans sp. LJ34]|uniref:alpha/beta fold hydrolase n=1 Tax=Phytohabitans sp. LJ34 TaxID=3452217 RepID=UPI003F88C018
MTTVYRVVGFVIAGGLALALGFLAVRPEGTFEVPAGARAGGWTAEPCTYDTEAGGLAADCGTLVVLENRRDPASDLIALPVVRIRATGGGAAGEPIFRLNGGPGATNLEFPQASRLTAGHDVVLVGYRGVDGSRRLDCPEVASALRRTADLGGTGARRAGVDAFAACATRLTGDGIDVTGYSIPQRVDDLEAARVALGYRRINLLSTSAGTRTAMIYSWRHPASLHRSAMIGVNPPGHFLWDPEITDRQFGRYTELCRQDAGCAARTGDLAATIRKTADGVPGRWGPLVVKEGNVRIAGMYGMFHSTGASAPLYGPAIVDAFLAADGGDAAGLWAMSTLADLVIPGSFVWGEFASFGMIDADAARRYYAAGGDHGSILRNTAADLLWGGPDGFHTVWPAAPDTGEYQTVRPSAVETLLVSGTVDFTTPAELADELLPSLSNGRHVTLAELGHTGDVWARTEASQRLLTAFFDRGEVDDSLFQRRPVDFEVGAVTMPAIARILLGAVLAGALLALLLLAGMALRVRGRGGFGPRAGVWLRFLTPLPLGFGGWCLAVLGIWALWPRVFVGDALVAIPSVGLAVGVGTYLAWVRRDRPRRLGFAVALAGSLLGAALGFAAAADLLALLTTIAGAAAVANLALLLLAIPKAARVPDRLPGAAPTATLRA